MTFKYSLTEADLIDFNYYAFWAAPDQKSRRFSYYSQIVIWVICTMLGFIIFSKRPFSINELVLLVAGAVAVALFWGYISMNVNFKTKMRALVTGDLNSNLYIPFTLQIGEFGITIDDLISEHRYSWNAIIKNKETKDYFYLFLNAYNSIIIPKKHVGAENIPELRNMLDKHLSLEVSLAPALIS
jgi:hypothetical protein